MSKPQPSFPSYNRTPKHLGCLNTLHPNPRDEFRTCWGHVEELLVDEDLWNDHKKLIFFLVASAATCTDSHLEVDQSLLIPYLLPNLGDYEVQEEEQVEDGNASE
ncbi:hypothetical protein Taro_042465 [Colocasia esculenta]|uniref:Uncharacterized protein n=1 Tax=Colocasia esculenta TaxID=4460 RepID=A0A843WII9_COLES|nr:hypothetical protein [Colocasia esculenta]